MLQQFEGRIQTLTAANQSMQSNIESLRKEVERLSVQRPSQQHIQVNREDQIHMEVSSYKYTSYPNGCGNTFNYRFDYVLKAHKVYYSN